MPRRLQWSRSSCGEIQELPERNVGAIPVAVRLRIAKRESMLSSVLRHPEEGPGCAEMLRAGPLAGGAQPEEAMNAVEHGIPPNIPWLMRRDLLTVRGCYRFYGFTDLH